MVLELWWNEWCSVNELLDGSNLLSVRKAFEKGQLGFNELNEFISLGSLQLIEQLFCTTVSIGSLGDIRRSYESHSCHTGRV